MAAGSGKGCTAGTHGGANNPLWLAPEVLAEGRYTAASDVFSFGIILWELLTLRMPWSDSGVSQWLVAGEVQRGGRPQVPPPEACPGLEAYVPYVRLMQHCWHQDPGRRPSFVAVCAELRWVAPAASAALRTDAFPCPLPLPLPCPCPAHAHALPCRRALRQGGGGVAGAC